MLLADGFAEVLVALTDAVGDTVAGGTSAWVPPAGLASVFPVSALWSTSSPTIKEATMSAPAAAMNSHRLCTGPP